MNKNQSVPPRLRDCSELVNPNNYINWLEREITLQSGTCISGDYLHGLTQALDMAKRLLK